MSDFRGEQFPRGALYGAGGMIGITMLVVFGIRTGVLPGRATAPQKREAAQVSVVASRDFRFADREDGALIATDAKTDEVALILEPGSNSGFIRGVMRGLMRERQLHEVARDGPVTVTQWADGALTVKDTSTDRIIELGSFGPTNRAAFAQLLVPGQHIVESELKTAARGGPKSPSDNSSVARDIKPGAV
ncbi:MAG: photosynthetic complex assembly protein PuhC [Polymorphobacter sp.]